MTRRTAVLVAMLLVALAVPATALAAEQLRAPATTVAASQPAPVQPSAPPPSSAPADVTRVEVEGETTSAVAPTRLRVPSLGIDSTLEDLRTDRDGRLQSPREWQQAGWFTDGAVPGETGPAVVAGHVDSPTGPAVFTRLGELRPGDEVDVVRDDGTTARFVVDRSETVGKGDFPTDEVYGATPDAQLRLITCDGPYVRSSGGYQDNLVVFATLVADGSGS